jgi:hypothetical protein
LSVYISCHSDEEIEELEEWCADNAVRIKDKLLLGPHPSPTTFVLKPKDDVQRVLIKLRWNKP